jgi:hypothetical protein
MKVTAAFFVTALSLTAFCADTFQVQRTPQAVILKNPSGQTIAQYQLQRPADTKLSVDGACYFHPVTTPKGIVVTEVGPSDHPHHRGIFLAWVEMHGKHDADFWGWGEHAPKNDRVIINREITDPLSNPRGAGFHAANQWLAETNLVITEQLRTAVRTEASANILDLVYTLTPASDLTLSRWAFSGFCVRVRKDGKLEAQGPGGAIALPNPKHTEPESDWPAGPWYGYTLTFPDGAVVGAAVIDHPKNPRSLWHNHRDVRMLNPCIVAPAAVIMKAGTPLVLRYRVVIHDGPTPRALLDNLAKDWSTPAE